MDLPEPNEDVDAVLRHVSRQFPRHLARALLPPGTPVTAVAWPDTQVTTRQRRLDRALTVTVGGKERHEHVEWQTEMAAEVPFRIFEYHALLALGLAAVVAAVATPPPHASPPPVRSTLVLLSGREKPWPAEGQYRTSPPDAPFSGVTFRIDAVYQRTVAELEARGPLWMIFAPLAVDADKERMAQVLAKLRAQTPKRAFEELAVAMLVMADKDKRHRGLRSDIVPLLSEEMVMDSWVYKQGEAKGEAKGKKQGIEEGKQQGIEQGIAKGIEQGIAKGIAPARKALVLFYETRFGTMPAALRERVQAAHDPDLVERWCDVVAQGTREDVDRALGQG